ncbi:hypothetical protein [Nocardiopsis potens]|uniref:hypothetical protein n=1 Tax=Nocardiopsis potens TaxID=1246458 RepID=UPI0003463454|nr:hypothetical protein [Nocardiopsis potens]
MNKNRALAGALWAVAAAVVAAAVVLLLPLDGVWTLALLLVLALALLVALVPLLLAIGRGSAEPVVVEAMPPPPPPPLRAHQISGIRLATAKEDYPCLFSALVQVCDVTGGGPPDEARMAAACESVLSRAEEFTSRRRPEEVGVAVYGLASVLGRPVRLEQDRMEVRATAVEIVLAEEDARRLMRMATVRKDKEVREHEWGEARDRRRYFQDDVLASPASAVVWWLFANQGRVQEAVRLIGPLTRLSDAANGRLGAEPRPDAPEGADPLLQSGSALVDKVGTDRGPEEQDAFTDRFARLLREHGQGGLSALLREKYESPDLTGHPTGGTIPQPGAAGPPEGGAAPPTGGAGPPAGGSEPPTAPGGGTSPGLNGTARPGG